MSGLYHSILSVFRNLQLCGRRCLLGRQWFRSIIHAVPPRETDLRTHAPTTPAVVENIRTYNLAFQSRLAFNAKRRDIKIFHADSSFIYHD